MVDEVQSVPPTEPTADLPSMVVGEPMKPVAATERIYTLDVLRGFAIFGIFMVNIAFFSMPLMNLLDPSLAKENLGDEISWSIVKAFFEFKFVSLFSTLFGIGLILQMQRAKTRHRPFAGMYLRRTFLLMAMGAIHGLLLWYGDILFIYSFVAIILLLMRELSPRLILKLAVISMSVSILLPTGLGLLGAVFEERAQQAQETESTEDENSVDSAEVKIDENTVSVSSMENVVDSDTEIQPQDAMARFWESLDFEKMQKGPESFTEAEIIGYKEGPMLATLVIRALEFGGMLVFAGIFGGFGFRVIAMFLFGAALMKLQFFEKQNAKWHRRFCVWGLGLGITSEVLVILCHKAFSDSTFAIVFIEAFHQAGSFILCLGYIGAITLIVQAGLLRWLTYAMSCVGRTALSNYLLQTIVATYIMYWWGLGMFNDVSRPQQMAIVVSVYCCQLVLSVLYLKVFSIGPFEWLWRSLTYLKFQPILRRASTTTP